MALINKVQKRLAVCIPIHDDAENYVKEAFLSGMPEAYFEHDIDIYFYDSSADLWIESLIKSKEEEGITNIYYVRMSPSTFLDTKLERIFRCEDHKYVYDYIWPCKASTWAVGATLDKIDQYLSGNYDIIVLNPENKEDGYYPPRYDKEYDDIDVFFHDLGAYLTGMAFRILKREAFLEGVEWDEIFDRYRVWVPNGTFYEIGLIFDRLSRLRSFRGILLSEGIILRNSVLKGSNSHWRGNEFTVWGECWPETIDRLPECYSQKDEVIKNKFHMSDLRLLRYLRQTGDLNIIVFFKYVKSWKRISRIPVFRFFLISIQPRMFDILAAWREEQYKKTLYFKYKRKREYIKNQVNAGKKLVIYGAGEVGNALAGFLKEDGIKQSYYAVTKQVIVFDVMGIPLVQIDQLRGMENEYCVLVGTVPRIQKEMKKTLDELKFTDVVYLR